ncbi:hypothetical protein RND81_13G108500 [Saponaria officinalis]|uniref:SBP-type domain-containing protein n=1 Tax=Saponaria officinalis TaxID=3572 RepID=A0AAW1H4K3_SAPOF
MESWCFDSLEKCYASNETITPSDSIIRTKDALIGFDFRNPSNYDNNILGQSQQSVENPNFPELGLSEMIRKQYPYQATVDDIVNPSLIWEEESSSKLSSSVVESNSRESSLIDLKLGGFGDNLNSNSSQAAPSSESSTPVRRVRGTRFSSQTVYCQVHGCNKDLSCAKDYHKRHKVCDAHSKTSKVIVNGIEQRFCQQCSRFHLLAEFDDGKRSCRKRLAGHNQRRRKPQIGYINGRAGRSFSYTGSAGSKFQENTLTVTAASFLSHDVLTRDASHAEKYGTNVWGAHVKVEDGSDYSHKSSNIFVDGSFHEKSPFPHFHIGEHYSSIDNLSNNTQNVPMNSLGSQDLTYIHEVRGISESGCALSLLSSQSRNSPGHSSGIPGAHSFVVPNISQHYNGSEVTEKFHDVGSQGLMSRHSNWYSLSGRNNESPMPVLSNGDSASSSFGNTIREGSEFMNATGTTIDLLQLSSQLQRVESQRQTASGKHQTEVLQCLK